LNTTQNIGLALPKPDDFYDIEVFNQNSRIIDALFQEIEVRRPKELIAIFLASGTFRPADHGLMSETVDVYMVGGGAGGHTGGASTFARGGGGGGFCRLLRDVRLSQASFSIVIGSGGQGSTGVGAGHAGTAGGNTIAFGNTAGGGSIAATTLSTVGGNGGSGGGGGNGDTTTGGGDGGFAGGGGGLIGGTGGGNANFSPVNPYDNVTYGCGGGGAPLGRGGGAGGAGGSSTALNRVNGFLGGGGGGGSGVFNHATRAGNGGIGGGGGGSTAATNNANNPAGNGGTGIVYIYARPRSGSRAASAVIPLSALSIDEYRVLEKTCAETYKNIGVMRDGICIDTAVFESLKMAKDFLKKGVWQEADAVVEIAPGCGIGDKCDGKIWTKQEYPEESA